MPSLSYRLADSPDIIGLDEYGIIKVLAYFDLFNYPLLKSEIRRFIDHRLSESALDLALQKLLESHNIFRIGEFYSIQNDPLSIRKRIEGNRRADELLRRAYRIGRFLSRFPFIRAVGISGSLSKNYADEKADIDFFVITKANRLWIARTLTQLFKKLTFITGHQNWYCMNYFVDEKALLIEDENIFNAVEIMTLLPVSGKAAMDHFFAANQWTGKWLPGCPRRIQLKADRKSLWLKMIFEKLVSGNLAEHLDNWLMKITTRRWRKKEARGKRNLKGLPMTLITGKHFAYSNAGSFREKLLLRYEAKIKSIIAGMITDPTFYGK